MDGNFPVTSKRSEQSQRIQINDGETIVASAEVVTSGGVARARLHAESGHLPAGTRAHLVDALLELEAVRDCSHLEVTIPVGDAESLLRLEMLAESTDVHAAGSSTLVDATLGAHD